MTKTDTTNEQEEPTDSAECRTCGDTLSGDDTTYRVLYGSFEDVQTENVSEKLIAGPNEELDPGCDERHYCFDCYKKEFDREKAAHFEYETPDQLWDILDGSNGELVADAKPMTVGGRGWFRVVDGEVQARHSVMVEGGENDDYDVGFDTEPTPDVDREEFENFFSPDRKIRLVLLKPLEETPLVAGMNHTLTNSGSSMEDN
jgi:hypothetical protein